MSGRVLALLGDSFYASGGIAQFNRDLIAAWVEMDSVTEIVLVPRFATGSRSGLPGKVVEKPPVRSLILYVLSAALESIRRPSFDFIFCGHLNMIPLAVILSRMTGTPVWLQLHGIEAWEKPSRTMRWSVERTALVTCVSRHTRRMFLRWACLPTHRVLVLPNTVGEQFNQNGKRDLQIANHELAENTVILTVSRLSTKEGYKGHDRVIGCMPELCAEFDNLVYAIAGAGDLQGSLQKLADSLGVGHAIKFLGPIGPNELPSVYRGADVFVMPSTGEGFGIVFLESIACGTPVIAGDSDGARDPLHDGALGMLCDDASLATSIRQALRSARTPMSNENSNGARAESVMRHFGRTAFSATVLAMTDRVLDMEFERVGADKSSC